MDPRPDGILMGLDRASRTGTEVYCQQCKLKNQCRIFLPKSRGPREEYRNLRSGVLLDVVALLLTVANPLTGEELELGSGRFNK